ncbi:hypothetical protein ARMSODRAFT_1084036 [Armillaria solidipes]|uniref:Uncharacterized protein n=1 Tax=Armillaria solidipes TaxID=1076256 RepID=A0A2H3BWI8_9AGAR|nr:hypothetical protein ARMSODRAFT_1084036 [Armillaria solidipes]
MPPSHYPPLHIAPLPSADSSDVSLLDDYDSSKPRTRVSYGGRRRISIAVIVPGILIFIACAVLASSLLVWLQSRRVESHIPREDQYFLNALVAIEGATAPPSSMMALWSLIQRCTVWAQLVSLTVPFLLGLLGYRLASMWILAQEKERTESMPTAAQYGLLVKLCGSANIFSAYETMRYLKRGREQRPQASSSLIFALTILVLAIVLNHLLSAADLWLHTTASTFIHTSITEIDAESMPPMGTKINLTACPGPTEYYYDSNHYGNCASTVTDFGWGDPEMVTEGLAVVGNNSSTSRSVMVGDMAVLVPSTMPDNVDNLTFSSFGLAAHCQPVVDCLVDSLSMQSIFYCPSFNPPYNISMNDEYTSYIDLLNLTNNALSPDPLGVYPLDSTLNPSGARITLYWPLSDDKTVFPAVYSPGWYVMESSYGTLDGNNTYAFADHPILSNFNTTSALFAALDRTYQMNLVNYLKSTLRSSSTLSTEAFNTVLSRNMSYAAMGLASPLFERDVSTGGNTILLRSASRYPLAPLSAVLAILYTYALLALVITASSVMLSSRELVVTKNGGKEHRVTAIELVQLRLTNPLASIAERFSDPARPELLLEPSAVDMFHDHPHAERLGVVMADDEGEGGEGIARRTQSLRVESVERRLTRFSDSTMIILETV